MKEIRKKKIKAYADVGSHGGIFSFEAGPVATVYPGLLHIYSRDLPGLIPVEITYDITVGKKTRKSKKI